MNKETKYSEAQGGEEPPVGALLWSARLTRGGAEGTEGNGAALIRSIASEARRQSRAEQSVLTRGGAEGTEGDGALK